MRYAYFLIPVNLESNQDMKLGASKSKHVGKNICHCVGIDEHNAGISKIWQVSKRVTVQGTDS